MKIPILHRHPTRNQGYVRVPVTREFIYFKSAKWPAGQKKAPPSVQAEYQEWLKQWLKANPAAAVPERLPPVVRPSVRELYDRYMAHCRGYYRKQYRDGERETPEVCLRHTACAIPARLYPMLPADEFEPQQLLECRNEMIRLGWSRKSINKAIGRVRAMFLWASEVEAGELIPDSVGARLLRLKGLKKNRCPGVPEGKGTRPADMEMVKATLPFCGPAVQAMVWTHYYLMCRSEDVVVMRPCDIHKEKFGLWRYDVAEGVGKSEHHHAEGTAAEREATRLRYPIIPELQELLTPWILKAGGWDSTQFLFPTGGSRGLAKGARGHYSTGSYRRHVERACDRLFPAPGKLAAQTITVLTRGGRAKRRLETEKERHARLTEAQRAELRRWQNEHSWNPYQLRHLRATEIGALFGTEASQRWMQHQHLSTTENYAQKRWEDVLKVAAEVARRSAS